MVIISNLLCRYPINTPNCQCHYVNSLPSTASNTAEAVAVAIFSVRSRRNFCRPIPTALLSTTTNAPTPPSKHIDRLHHPRPLTMGIIAAIPCAKPLYHGWSLVWRLQQLSILKMVGSASLFSARANKKPGCIFFYQSSWLIITLCRLVNNSGNRSRFWNLCRCSLLCFASSVLQFVVASIFAVRLLNTGNATEAVALAKEGEQQHQEV